MPKEARAYEMEMIFSASVGLKQINDFMYQMGCRDTLQIKDALNISVKQVLPVIPDDEYIRKIAETIKSNYETKDINLTECHFTGYKYLREIKLGRENGG